MNPDAVTKYAMKRERFGQTIAHFQVHEDLFAYCPGRRTVD